MSQSSLLKSKRFAPLFWTQFFGAFNDNFLKNALVILITYKAASVFGIPSGEMVAVSGGIFILPFFLFSATAGQMADKYEKTRMIRWIKLAEIAIMILASAGFLLQHFEFLFAVLFLMGLHSTFFGPIKYSILPQHLEERELVGGNALIEAGTFLSILLGTIAGGVLISLDHIGPILVSTGLVAVALAGWGTSYLIPVAKPVDPSLKVEWNPIPPTWRVFQLIRKTRPVFLSIMGISWFWFFGGAVLSLFPPYAKEVLKADQTVVTLFLACFSIGIGIGSLLCEKFSRQRLELGLVPLGSIGITLFTFDLFCAGVPSFALQATRLLRLGDFIHHAAGVRILLDLLFLSIFSGFFIVPLYTLIQERADPAFRSRIIAGNNIVNALFMVVSAGVLLLLMRLHFSIPQIFLFLALLNAAVALYIYLLLPEFLMRFSMWILANIMYRLRITGSERIPKEGAAVLVCNHVSFVDWMIISAGVARPIRFIMDKNFAKGFWVRMLLKQAKVILIAPEREDPAIMAAAFEKAKEELGAGELVCIFPEGKITRNGEMSPFKTGVERIIRETPVPVVPMALVGLWGSFFSRDGGQAIKKVPRRFWSKIELRIGTPVRAEEALAATLSAKVKDLRGSRL